MVKGSYSSRADEVVRPVRRSPRRGRLRVSRGTPGVDLAARIKGRSPALLELPDNPHRAAEDKGYNKHNKPRNTTIPLRTNPRTVSPPSRSTRALATTTARRPRTQKPNQMPTGHSPP